MDNFAYTSKIGDNAKFVCPPTSEQNAKFVYMKLSEIRLGGFEMEVNI